MDEELFGECTAKLEVIGEEFGMLLEKLEKADESATPSVYKIKEALEFIYDTVNKL